VRIHLATRMEAGSTDVVQCSSYAGMFTRWESSCRAEVAQRSQASGPLHHLATVPTHSRALIEPAPQPCREGPVLTITLSLTLTKLSLLRWPAARAGFRSPGVRSAGNFRKRPEKPSHLLEQLPVDGFAGPLRIFAGLLALLRHQLVQEPDQEPAHTGS